MQWRTKVWPHVDSHRERIVFAWFPIDCEDGRTRWLEKVRVLERFTCHGKWSERFTCHGKWRRIRAYRPDVEGKHEAWRKAEKWHRERHP